MNDQRDVAAPVVAVPPIKRPVAIIEKVTVAHDGPDSLMADWTVQYSGRQYRVHSYFNSRFIRIFAATTWRHVSGRHIEAAIREALNQCNWVSPHLRARYGTLGVVAPSGQERQPRSAFDLQFIRAARDQVEDATREADQLGWMQAPYQQLKRGVSA